ncbi:acyl-CoA N-acyltransferase [Diplogelasinospora grovesii]|uniref:N-alpha-acetyltransferase 40 n=1 Tax=Diplogelasinospora grovesii TaxID=303347 RepID=A0AAN6MVA0_9PEZI|nr:acyl-CoA N-acyltransferase [Diplogelasinospora grovesii]
MRMKRRRAPTDPIERVNRLPDEEFIARYLQPSSEWVTEWKHPRTNALYDVSLLRSEKLSESDLTACFDLIEETSRKDYENSTTKWQPSKKLKEMRSPDLRYILVKDAADTDGSSLRGFTSLMPTYEYGQAVIYCYEIHLKPELRGTGLGQLLMSFLTTVASNIGKPITKVMLTCFVANQKGLEFYKKLGFDKDEISPGPRKLRHNKVFTPDYVIMSKTAVPQLNTENNSTADGVQSRGGGK